MTIFSRSMNDQRGRGSTWFYLMLLGWLCYTAYKGGWLDDFVPRAASLEKTGILENWPPPSRNPEKAEIAKDLTAKNYYVIFDGSGSMLERKCSGNDTKAAAARKAVSQFANAVPAKANLGMLVFDGRGIAERVALADNNRREFQSAVNGIYASGATPLKTAITQGKEKLEEQGRKQLGYGEYHLVVVTDGEANQGEDPTDVVNEIVTKSPIVLHTIGFCIGTRHSLNQPNRTIYKAADNPAALAEGLGDVLAESEEFDVSDFEKH